jgi:type I restriction enzyme M protein
VEIDETNRLEIVDSLTRFEDNEFTRKFSKYHFYFNKQTIELTNLDDDGNTFADQLAMVTKRDGSEERAKSEKLDPVSLSDGETMIAEFTITEYDADKFSSLAEAFDAYWKPTVAAFDYREQPLSVKTADAIYHFDNERETLVRTTAKGQESLGCGKIVVKAALKKKTKKLPECVELSVELTPDTQTDYEIIPFDPDPDINQANIEAFMAKYVFKPFAYLDNVVGAEINFNKVFYRSEELRSVKSLLSKLEKLEDNLRELEEAVKS